MCFTECAQKSAQIIAMLTCSQNTLCFVHCHGIRRMHSKMSSSTCKQAYSGFSHFCLRMAHFNAQMKETVRTICSLSL